jgi:hypothetical protein
MKECRGITDAAFEHLRGIHTLKMWCFVGITDAAFVHLRGINTLVMYGSRRITGAAFKHLRGIRALNMGSLPEHSKLRAIARGLGLPVVWMEHSELLSSIPDLSPSEGEGEE